MPNDQPTNGRDSMQARIKSKYFGSLQIPQLMPCSENTYENTISCIWYRNTFEIGINFFSARGPCGSCPRRPLSRRRLRLLGPRQWLPVPCGGCPRRPWSRRRLRLLGDLVRLSFCFYTFFLVIFGPYLTSFCLANFLTVFSS